MGTCQSELTIKHRSRNLHLRHLDGKDDKNKAQTMDEETLKKILLGVFDKFDRNHDGYLDFGEAEDLIKHTYLKSNRNQTLNFYRHATRKLFHAADLKGEGRISQEDFYRLYKSC